MKDITFRMTPVGKKEALSMLDSIAAAEKAPRGVRGAKCASRSAPADIIAKVSKMVNDFSEILEVDLNPIFATEKGARAVDVRIVIGDKPQTRQHFDQSAILAAMQRIMNPRSVAGIGASAEDGKIGNSVMKNLINGGYQARSIRSIRKLRRSWGARPIRACSTSPRKSTSQCSRYRRNFAPRRWMKWGEKKFPARS